MGGNPNNPNQQAYLDSFQGKDASALDNLDNSVKSQLIREGYRVDRVPGSPNFNKIVHKSQVYTPTTRKVEKVDIRNVQNQNPAPLDRSLFNPKPDNISVPKSSITSYKNTFNDLSAFGYNEPVNVSTSTDNVTPQYDQFGDTLPPNTDQGSMNKAVSKDAPENYDTLDTALNDELYSGQQNINNVLEDSNKRQIKVNSSQDAKTNQGSFTEDLSNVEINPSPNELNQFSSVSYNIALYMMNSKSYVDMTKSPSSPQEALKQPNSFLLMRSGGVGLENAGTEFNNDFFIDDLEITNIAVGPSKFKQNTNATDIRFVITEPRGVTLLERLQRLAGTVLASTREKYIHAPYLLEITFKGYDENGTPLPAPSLPKYIPIRITDMKFEVNTSGTQYRVTAIPFANHIFGSINSTIPFNIELQASTIGEIFSTGITKVVMEQERVQDNPELEAFGGFGDQQSFEKKYKLKNLAEALTDAQRKRTKETDYYNKSKKKYIPVPAAAEKHDTYSFLLAQEISEAKLNLDGIYDALNTPAPTEGEKQTESTGDKKQYETWVRSSFKGITLDKTTGVFKINSGTDITKLINLVIMHSDYMDQNIEENPNQYANSGKPINWFKIRPVIVSSNPPGGGYDAKDGRYKYQVQYVVEKNNVYYSDMPWARKSKPVGNGYHKKYDFIFSGKNTEVLDFDLKFNTAFLQVMSAGTGTKFASKPSNTAFTPVVKEVVESIEGNSITSKDTLVRKRSKDLFSSIMSDGIDMVELDMRIVGDPAWIPTSDAYWQDRVREGKSYTTPFMPDGTINYNLTAPYIQLNLKTPVDYDAVTGLQDPNQVGNSSFSGVYRITSIDSTFAGGVFQQRLMGIRAHLQPTNVGTARDNKTDTIRLATDTQDAIINNGQDYSDFANVNKNSKSGNRGNAIMVDDFKQATITSTENVDDYDQVLNNPSRIISRDLNDTDQSGRIRGGL